MTASTAVLTATRLLPLVDRADFRTLFVEELGWENPDQPPRTITVEDQPYVLTQVAGYKGMRIWHCPELPGRRIQRAIDQAIAKDNLERLVIFTSTTVQEWRWPRRAQTGGVNAKLLVHTHTVGQGDPHLVDQLEAITIDFDEDPSLVEVLSRMRAAFDVEAEAASVAAARLMARLYNALDETELDANEATLLLARLLFLLFGDDSGMWRANMFRDWLATHTTATTLHTDLAGLFEVLNTPEKQRILPAGSPLADFRYVNGGLYQDHLHLVPLNEDFRAGLVEACDFDWSLISPAVFGSMFQVVKDKEARREGGEHYTTEENILKTINPLFLDEYRDRLEEAWDDKGQLTKLHNELGRLKIMDPACGCGNFLIVSYRELRALELEILKRRRDLDEADANWGRSQMTLDVTGDIKVTLNQFYGIEIEEWPARIAEVAMLLVDHLANQAMEEEFGVAPDRLPIKIAPRIVHGNALREDWRAVLRLQPGDEADYLIILGNPPFIGMSRMSAEQQQDNRIVFASIDSAGLRTGRMDYVACWYVKAMTLLRGSKGKAAFVSTSSITQGEQARTMVPLLARNGFEVDFGHRTFKWVSEAPGAAAVDVVIIGFSSSGGRKRRRLYDYPNPAGQPVESIPSRLSFYLIDAPDVTLVKLRSPLVGELPNMTKGSQPTDAGHLLVEPEDLVEVETDPVARRYLRRFVGAKEMLHDIERSCLWLVESTVSERDSSRIIRERTAKVAEFRNGSPTRSVRDQAKTPWLFTQNRQPRRRYLALPKVSSENRQYIPMAYFEPDVIAGDALLTLEDAPLWLFGYLESSAYTAWVKTFTGRLTTRLQVLPALVYFTFPFIVPGDVRREEIEAAADAVLEARLKYPESTLASLYDPQGMPLELRQAHDHLDELIDAQHGLVDPTDSERMKALVRDYQRIAAPLLAATATGARGSRRVVADGPQL